MFNEKTGKLVSLIEVEADQDLLIMASNGIVIRTPVKDVPVHGRNTPGVKIMKLRANTKIVSVAVGEHEEEEEETITAEDIVVANITNETQENKQD